MCKFLLRTNFCGQAAPTKIKPTIICTHEEFSNSNYSGLLWPAKIYPLKNLIHEYCDHENFMFTVFHISLQYFIDTAKRGILEIDKQGKVVNFLEKPTPDQTASRNAVSSFLL